MPKPMQDSEIRNSLANLGGWTLQGNAIVREFNFTDFVQAMVFVNRVAGVAEDAGHHPDITIVYNHVTLRLSTHDAGGITVNDIRMAETLNGLPESSQTEQRRKAG
jgi:4a-hydroxytetrahydrobiopterin dehydratase